MLDTMQHGNEQSSLGHIRSFIQHRSSRRRDAISKYYRCALLENNETQLTSPWMMISITSVKVRSLHGDRSAFKYRRIIGTLAWIARKVCVEETTTGTTSARGAQAYRSRQKSFSQTLTTYEPQTNRFTRYFIIAETQPGMAKVSIDG